MLGEGLVKLQLWKREFAIALLARDLFYQLRPLRDQAVILMMDTNAPLHHSQASRQNKVASLNVEHILNCGQFRILEEFDAWTR